MAKIELSQGFIAEIDDADLDPVSQYSWHAVRVTNSTKIYARRSFWAEKGVMRTEYLHHFIIGKREGLVVDHIDGNSLNNRRCNLRHCTRNENKKNYPPRPSRTGVPNVQQLPNGIYRVKLSVDGIRRHFGCFKTLEEASAAAYAAVLETRGEFAHKDMLNLTAKGELA